MDFFIADTHFFDENIIKYENRPFKNSQEMLESICGKWNEVVRDEDRVFVAGDFLSVTYDMTEQDFECLCGLKGHKYLLRGNHDLLEDDFYLKCGFEKVYDYPIIYDGFWIISHEPMYMNDNMPYANIYGHVHGNDMYKDYSAHSFCVSVERLNYCPVSIEIIKNAVVNNAKS